MIQPMPKEVYLAGLQARNQYNREVVEAMLEHQARLEAMIAKAYSADLQTMSWFLKWLLVRYTLGDFHNQLHDELHIDQAQQVLAAYEQRVAVQKSAV